MGSMAPFHDLFDADATLQALADDSDRLQQARRRFETTPPVYRSRPSADITRLHSPGPATEEERRARDEKSRLFYVELHRHNSRPGAHFRMQSSKEVGFLLERWQEQFGSNCYGSLDDNKIAERIVCDRWRKWGIWADDWENTLESWSWTRWEHDMVPGDDGNGDDDDDDDDCPDAKGALDGDDGGARGPSKPPDAAISRLGYAPERTAEERDQDNSRPYNLFLLLVGVERQRLRERERPAGGPDPLDINTRAYDAVREQWKQQGIWRTTWGTLPGMTWKHEHPLREIIDEEAHLTLAELDDRQYLHARFPDRTNGGHDSIQEDSATPYSVQCHSPVRLAQDPISQEAQARHGGRSGPPTVVDEGSDDHPAENPFRLQWSGAKDLFGTAVSQPGSPSGKPRRQSGKGKSPKRRKRGTGAADNDRFSPQAGSEVPPVKGQGVARRSKRLAGKEAGAGSALRSSRRGKRKEE